MDFSSGWRLAGLPRACLKILTQQIILILLLIVIL